MNIGDLVRGKWEDSSIGVIIGFSDRYVRVVWFDDGPTGDYLYDYPQLVLFSKKAA